MKDRMMSTAPIIAENIKNRIRRVCVEVTLEMLVHVRDCFRQKILKCILVGHHFKHRK